MILHLNLKQEHFEAIKRGEKNYEYRLAEKWKKRICGKPFTEIRLCLGYPNKNDFSKILMRKFVGYSHKTIIHPIFGKNPVDVLAIDVSHPL
jgi:hypothetical protein